MSESLSQWCVTKEIRGSWGNDKGAATVVEFVNADRIIFQPGHVVFYDGMDMIVKAIPNSQVLDIWDSTYERDGAESRYP